MLANDSERTNKTDKIDHTAAIRFHRLLFFPHITPATSAAVCFSSWISIPTFRRSTFEIHAFECSLQHKRLNFTNDIPTKIQIARSITWKVSSVLFYFFFLIVFIFSLSLSCFFSCFLTPFFDNHLVVKYRQYENTKVHFAREKRKGEI